jgi:PucR C-terminal helix-turn-helix domain/GGDEF-like domain
MTARKAGPASPPPGGRPDRSPARPASAVAPASPARPDTTADAKARPGTSADSKGRPGTSADGKARPDSRTRPGSRTRPDSKARPVSKDSPASPVLPARPDTRPKDPAGTASPAPPPRPDTRPKDPASTAGPGRSAAAGSGTPAGSSAQEAAPAAGPGGRAAGTGRVRDETITRLEQSMSALGAAAMASMDRRLPWFRAMSAEHRSWLGLVAQAGVAAFVDWVRHPERSRPAVAGEVFGTAPRELARAVSLQQAVEMVRVIIDVVETQVDGLAAPGGEAELREAVLRYTREIAFGAAQVYARTAEARGAWDARLEALVIEALVRGEADEGLQSWAAALNWSSAPVTVIAGASGGEEPAALIDDLGVIARRARLDVLAGVHGHRLVMVVGGAADPLAAARHFAGRFGAGPVVAGPVVADLLSATGSAAAALAGLRAAAAWPDAPRPVLASDLLPERALDGDERARAELIERVYEPLQRGGGALLDTALTYLELGSSLEATARTLFVHPNTVRYRLRRVSELTGIVPGEGRGGFSLWVAAVYGRLAD